MKNLLIIGNVASLAAHLCQRLSRQYHMVVASRLTPPIAFGKGVEVFDLSDEKTLEQVFQAHTFQAVVFLATRGEQQSRIPGEADQLSCALAQAKRHGVDRVLFLTSGELSRISEAAGERGMLMQAMEQLCLAYRKQGVDVSIVRLPCVFGPGETDTLVGRMLLSAVKGETAVLPFTRDAQIDFISAAEVAQLVYRLLERDGRPGELLMVRGAETLTVRELTALFGLLGASVSQGAAEAGYPPMEGGDFQHSYGITPSERLSVALDNLYLGTRVLLGKQDAQKNRIRSFFKRHPALVKGTSLLTGFAAMEALQLLQESGDFPTVDLRLLYVAMIGAAHGLQAGLFAIVFACFSLARSYGAQGLDFNAFLNDWKTWVPFLMLILTGTFTGYARDKGRRDVRTAQEAVDTLEKRCSFLQDLYKQSLLAKEEPTPKAADKQDRMEMQLAQLRQGQERLEQEWMTLIKREQARFGSLPDAEADKEQARMEEEAGLNKARLEKQAEQARLKQTLLENARREETARAEPVVSDIPKPLKELPERTSANRPSRILDLLQEQAEEDDLALGEISPQYGEDESNEPPAPKESGIKGIKQEAAEPVRQNWADPSSQKDKVILSSSSPFGNMSPAERRKMLEAMQVRTRPGPNGKNRRKR